MLGCAHVAAWCGYCYHRGREDVFAEEGKEDAFGMGNKSGCGRPMLYLLSQRKRGFFHREKKEFRANVIRYYQGGNAVFFAERRRNLGRMLFAIIKEETSFFSQRKEKRMPLAWGITWVWPPEVVIVITEEGRWFSQRKGKRMPLAWGITWLWGVDWGMQGCGRPNTIV